MNTSVKKITNSFHSYYNKPPLVTTPLSESRANNSSNGSINGKVKSKERVSTNPSLS